MGGGWRRREALVIHILECCEAIPMLYQRGAWTGRGSRECAWLMTENAVIDKADYLPLK